MNNYSWLSVEKVKNLKISQKIERSEQVKFSIKPFLKGLAGARGGSPKPCERLAQHKNKVYRQADCRK